MRQGALGFNHGCAQHLASVARGLLLLSCLIAVTVTAVSSAKAAPTATQRCIAKKIRAVGNYQNCIARHTANFIQRGRAPRFHVCDKSFVRRFSRAEARGGCPTIGDLEVRKAAARACVVDVDVALESSAPKTHSGRCEGNKMRVGFRFGARKARVKARFVLKDLDPTTTNFSKLSARMAKRYARFESRFSTCPTTEDATPIETIIEQCIDIALAEISATGPTATPTNSPIPSSTPTVADTPTPTNTVPPTDTPTAEPTATATDTPVNTETPTNTVAPTDTPTAEATATATDTPVNTETPTNTVAPTDTPTAEATATDTPVNTETPTNTAAPTDTPTAEATATATDSSTATATPTSTATPTATSTPIPTAPTSFRRVFVTSVRYNGNLGGRGGANAKCTQLATAAGLPGKFRAWVSQGNSNEEARDNVENAEVPFLLVDGTIVANNWNDLTNGNLDNPINLDENGVTRSFTKNIWTGTADDGSEVTGLAGSVRCQGWTSGSGSDKGRTGSSSVIGSGWTNEGGVLPNVTCDSLKRLYCFQSNPLTVFVSSIPASAGFARGVEGADNFCDGLAQGAGLEGKYVAWLSSAGGTVGDAPEAKMRIRNYVGIYQLVNGTKVADNWVDLTDGTLDNPINIDQNGSLVSGTNNVWTGSTSDGSRFGTDCNNWTSSSKGDFGKVGSTNLSGVGWSEGNLEDCRNSQHVYCFETKIRCGTQGDKCAFQTLTDHFDPPFYQIKGDLGGLSGADAICQAAADFSSGVQDGVYKAWLSTPSTSAALRLSQSLTPYRRMDGVKIADNWTDLIDGTLDNPLCQGEIDVNPTNCNAGCPAAWTGTDSSGNYSSPSCSSWTDDGGALESLMGLAGNACEVDTKWTDFGDVDCFTGIALYCLQQ